MAANHLYLSKLDEENANPPTVPLNGHWHAAEARLLGSIADGIDVSQQSRDDVRGVSSVPDVWARPVLFQSALRNAKHPLHERMVREWRGLLSLLALRRVHNFPVEFVPVPLAGGTFARALETLAPPPVQLEAEQRYAWTDVLMIRWARNQERIIPLGAFSPSTLVYTATAYQHRLRDEQLNLRDTRGFLHPPTDREDLLAVAEWVKRQKDHLDGLLDKRRENPDDRTVLLLDELFNGWLADLRDQLPGVNLDSADVKVAEAHHDYAPRRGPRSTATASTRPSSARSSSTRRAG